MAKDNLILDEEDDNPILKHKYNSLGIAIFSIIMGCYNRYEMYPKAEEILKHPLVCFTGFSESDIGLMIVNVLFIQFFVSMLIFRLFHGKINLKKGIILNPQYWTLSFCLGVIVFILVLLGWEGVNFVYDF